jgi:hypothetical protein
MRPATGALVPGASRGVRRRPVGVAWLGAAETWRPR